MADRGPTKHEANAFLAELDKQAQYGGAIDPLPGAVAQAGVVRTIGWPLAMADLALEELRRGKKPVSGLLEEGRRDAGIVNLSKMSAKKRAKWFDLVNRVSGIDLKPGSGTQATRFQMEPGDIPISRGGRGQVYFKTAPANSEIAKQYEKPYSPTMYIDEGGAHLVTKKPTFSGTLLRLHNQEGTRKRLGLSPDELLHKRAFSGMSRNELQRLSGTSKNTVEKLIPPQDTSSYLTKGNPSIPFWRANDFLMSKQLERAGISRVLRDPAFLKKQFSPSHVDYVEVRPGDYSRVPELITANKRIKHYQKEQKQGKPLTPEAQVLLDTLGKWAPPKPKTKTAGRN